MSRPTPPQVPQDLGTAEQGLDRVPDRGIPLLAPRRPLVGSSDLALLAYGVEAGQVVLQQVLYGSGQFRVKR